MKTSYKAYVEEILFSFDVIIALLCYHYGLKTFMYLFIAKAVFDFYCGMKYAFKNALESAQKKKKKRK